MSALLARALSVSAVGWQKMLTEGCSLEKALTFCLINQDQDLKAAVQSLLYSAVRQRAKTSLLLEKLVHKEPTPTNKAILSIALALLLEQKEKTFCCRPEKDGSDAYKTISGWRKSDLRRRPQREKRTWRYSSDASRSDCSRRSPSLLKSLSALAGCIRTGMSVLRRSSFSRGAADWRNPSTRA